MELAGIAIIHYKCPVLIDQIYQSEHTFHHKSTPCSTSLLQMPHFHAYSKTFYITQTLTSIGGFKNFGVDNFCDQSHKNLSETEGTLATQTYQKLSCLSTSCFNSSGVLIFYGNQVSHVAYCEKFLQLAVSQRADEYRNRFQDMLIK